MRTSRFFTSILALALLTLTYGAALAADPGLAYPATSAISDQKAGSVLIFPVYTSSPTNTAQENTRITITNTSATRPVGIHLFFIDGALCSPADNVLCLTPNQTTSFRVADFDPGTTGYIVAVAVNSLGCPISHNFLIGDAFVKFATGHEANLGAEAVSYVGGIPVGSPIPGCSDTESAVTLNFNDAQYGRLPAVLAIDNLPSAADGNSTRVIVSRPAGDLSVGAATIGTIFGILYNDVEAPYSYQLAAPNCQLNFIFSNNQPRLAPRFSTIVPSGRSGWTRFYSFGGSAIVGAVINYNAGAAASSSAYNQGHNLHKLTLAPTSSLTIPVFPPNCTILD